MTSRLDFIVTVRGSGAFPIDMLRYDAAHPYQERDSAAIEHIARSREVGDVRVVMTHEPTAERWASFGWRVVSIEKRRT